MLDERNIPDPLKIPHSWIQEEGMIFLVYTPLSIIYSNYLMFNPSDLGSNDLSEYKIQKAHSYQYGWLQPPIRAIYHNLSGSKLCVLRLSVDSHNPSKIHFIKCG